MSSEPAAASEAVRVLAEHRDFVLALKPAGMNFHSEDGEAGFVVQVRTGAGSGPLNHSAAPHAMQLRPL